MEITDTKIEELAHLARLEFKESDKHKIKSDLERIVGFFDKLSEIDTEGLEPLIYMSDRTNNLRPDVVHSDFNKEQALFNAPDKDSDYFKVPKFINK
ncbi:MAG: Asp-tRNA(Asn)/Glu-tRNA(Gln) amidotransferase subunit GatC [Flavobacteriales bacterium]|nr:Asp-tRNA(Asn)/Glu-tRNA(Gln) amidotransferase subunit GatC [Flavobacteriales bacterium]